MGRPSDDGFDLGASWVWPEAQPTVAALVEELRLTLMPQHGEGDVIFHRISRETPQRFRRAADAPSDPSMRVVGGTGALVSALARDLPLERIRLGTRVTSLALGVSEVRLTIERADGSSGVLSADQVVAALPPRLLETTVSFAPAFDEATAQRWRDTPTWMAPHVEFFAFHDRSFRLRPGLSGTIQRLVGPLSEAHDATTAYGVPALLGFLGVGAGQRAAMGEAALTAACVEQLARGFGEEARHPRSALVAGWATGALTSTARDLTDGEHPTAAEEAWLTGRWQERLFLAGNESRRPGLCRRRD